MTKEGQIHLFFTVVMLIVKNGQSIKTPRSWKHWNFQGTHWCPRKGKSQSREDKVSCPKYFSSLFVPPIRSLGLLSSTATEWKLQPPFLLPPWLFLLWNAQTIPSWPPFYPHHCIPGSSSGRHLLLNHTSHMPEDQISYLHIFSSLYVHPDPMPMTTF